MKLLPSSLGCYRPVPICVISILLSALSPDFGNAQFDLEKMRSLNPRMPQPLQIDQARVEALGIRHLKSRHLDLYTDIRGVDEIEELPQLFDKAVPLWCQYFGVASEKAKHYRLRAFVFDKAQLPKFRQAGLVPHYLPTFPAGYNIGHEMWVFLQPDWYYTRHLLLHEGTHAFMQWHLGSSGPPWYSEGMAELLAVHTWQDGELKIAHRPQRRQDCPGWGRVKIIRDECHQQPPKTLVQVTNIQSGVFALPRPVGYAWAWAACDFLSQHPLTQSSFDELKKTNPERRQFRSGINQLLDTNAEQLGADWEQFCSEIEFGYDIGRAAMMEAQQDSAGNYLIRADRGWQQTDFRVRPGDKIRISATGRFIVARVGEEIWSSEAGGVTIEYYRGRPLGELTLAVMGDGAFGDACLSQATPVGLANELVMPTAGRVCLRINESAARLSDNQDSLTVKIEN